jgi:hypothetical protein
MNPGAVNILHRGCQPLNTAFKEGGGSINTSSVKRPGESSMKVFK